MVPYCLIQISGEVSQVLKALDHIGVTLRSVRPRQFYMFCSLYASFVCMLHTFQIYMRLFVIYCLDIFPSTNCICLSLVYQCDPFRMWKCWEGWVTGMHACYALLFLWQFIDFSHVMVNGTGNTLQEKLFQQGQHIMQGSVLQMGWWYCLRQYFQGTTCKLEIPIMAI